MANHPTHRRRPTRRDLLVVISRIQHHISGAIMHEAHEGQEPKPLRDELQLGLDLCFEALSQDPPVDVTRGEWARNFGQ